MTPDACQAGESTRRLREVLERTAGALASADLEGLLRSEVELAVAIGRITPVSALSPEERIALRHEVQSLQLALARCRRLGGALLDVVRIGMDAQGRGGEYGRRDAVAAAAPARIRTVG